MENLFSHTADFYDLDIRSIERHDLPFYLDFANRFGGPVLELACGTGRVTIPLADAGFPVWGLDLSEAMLSVFRRKLIGADPTTTERIHLIRSDMADFRLPERFPLIIVPFRGFQALTGDDRIRSCLASVRRHLAPGGRFILDVFSVDSRLDESWIHGEQFDWTYQDRRTNTMIVRTGSRDRIDTRRQILDSSIMYYLRRPDGSEERLLDRISLKYWYEYQLQALLASSGFRIEAEYGSYDRRPPGTGSEFIFVCSRLHLPGESGGPNGEDAAEDTE